MAAGAVAGLGAVGSIFGGLFGAGASSTAADQYIAALQQAQTELTGSSGNALKYLTPYTNTGSTATAQLQDLLGTPGKGLLTPWDQQFTAPTEAQAEATPGFKFQLKQGEDAIQNSTAGKGSLLTGRTLADLNNFAQGTASQNYQNVFNNAFTQYRSAYDTFLNNQNNTYNRLMGASGQGLNAAGTSAGITMNTGENIASLIGQEGAARAAGTIGSANAYGSILPGIANSIGGLSIGSLMNPSSTTNLMTPSYMPGGGTGFPGFDPNGTGMLPLSALNNVQMPTVPTY